MKLVKSTLAALIASAAFAGASYAAEQIHVAGSSTVLPYAKIVSETFAETYPDFKAPVVESGGTGAGLKEFCKGVGPETIDIANASRKIKDSEIETCKSNGVTDITEVKIGYDGIVFALDKSAPDFALDPADVYLALAAEVPVDGKMAANPNVNWKTVNAKFADLDIQAFIPGEKHGTREVFEEKLLIAGCKKVGALELMTKSGINEKDAEKKCKAVRKDGKAVDIDGDYSETLARIDANKKAVGVFGLSFYENNADKLKVATVGGVTPSVETVAKGEYPVSRPLFFYVKKAHLEAVPGLKEYVEFFTSDQMIGPDSPLAEYGLIPAPDAEREEIRAAVTSWKNM
ncbi:substrate-binding domain-containing protein [Rhizobium sp. KVB221]|uniref:Substrate-binding domain-containing protein n=1 Tax=Rhizobium setariae TaxID=2801340 RepID=A0A936YRK9_9HYPH|nr:substrate-binding domain-containing protein [Rhizobium setariae]MBL0371491.1 substrate-binding domain-containing protein [Rhizobium setariae]